MPVKISNSCIDELNQTYYQSQLSPPKFISLDSKYSIYLDIKNAKWILAHINAKKTFFNIHYYSCK